MTNTGILNEAAPAWVTTKTISGAYFDVRLQPPLRGGGQGKSYDLRIAGESGRLVVREQRPGECLPAACPERHINFDGTFCIGLGAGSSLFSSADAKHWWKLLGEYLGCQQIADKYKRWPPEYGLSHGDAAVHQIAMKKIARDLGWESEISDAIAFVEGWLAGDLPRIRKGTQMLVNQRALCPRLCDCRKAPLLRRRCPNRESIAQLVVLESKRRKEEASFIEGYRRKGFKCCGTMDACPFKNQA